MSRDGFGETLKIVALILGWVILELGWPRLAILLIGWALSGGNDES